MEEMYFKVIVVATSLWLCFQGFGVFGLVAEETISREEDDLELDKLLQILNKPAIKTFRNEYGNIYDCVDIEKQPSLDHPLLKNHKVQVKPNSRGPNIVSTSSYMDCSEGTVPIRRTTKEDLIRGKSFFKQQGAAVHPMLQDGPGYYFAGIQTKVNSNNYGGVGAFLTVCKPTVQDSQWSGAMIQVQNQLDYIKAGWMINKDLYGDTSTRLFTLWAASDNKTGCYNIHCPGFVQTDANTPLDFTFPDSTKLKVNTSITITQDNANNWMLLFGEDFKQIGYWPKELFSGLASWATQIKMGGQVYAGNSNYFPGMGNDVYDANSQDTAAMFKILIVNDLNNTVRPDDNMFEIHEERCYFAGNLLYNGDEKARLGCNFLYGSSATTVEQCKARVSIGIPSFNYMHDI